MRTDKDFNLELGGGYHSLFEKNLSTIRVMESIGAKLGVRCRRWEWLVVGDKLSSLFAESKSS